MKRRKPTSKMQVPTSTNARCSGGLFAHLRRLCICIRRQPLVPTPVILPAVTVDLCAQTPQGLNSVHGPERAV